jgi:hypothetical protein
MSFVPITSEIRNVGKRIKSSKKKYSWSFQILKGATVYHLDLYVSKFTGKKKVVLNGHVKFSGKKKSGGIFRLGIK